MDLTRLWTSWQSLALVLLSTVAIYLVVVGYTRLAGARSLATMSSFDFAATVAIGSTVSTAANLGTPLAHGVASLAILYGAQLVATGLRRRGRAGPALDNSPILMFADGKVIERGLRAGHVVEAEIWAAVRRAGVSDLDDVNAVVLETTGDLSVLRRTDTSGVDERLLAGVRMVDDRGPHPSTGHR